MPRRRWNHNLHFHEMLLSEMPPGCRRALDVGCGDGTLARRLRVAVPSVCGVDADAGIIELARQQTPDGQIEYIAADFLGAELEPASFDFVTCVATLHHVDAAAALARFRELLAPGGTLAILGLARSRYPADLPRDALATAVSRSHRLVRERWDPPVRVVWPPPYTYTEIRQLMMAELPGAAFRRHLLWRFSVVWSKPVGQAF